MCLEEYVALWETEIQVSPGKYEYGLYRQQHKMVAHRFRDKIVYLHDKNLVAWDPEILAFLPPFCANRESSSPPSRVFPERPYQ